MDFDTRLAACHVDVVRLRDREKSYNPMDATQRRELAPAFPWDAFFEGTGAPSAATEVVSIGQPEFVSAAAELLARSEERRVGKECRSRRATGQRIANCRARR